MVMINQQLEDDNNHGSGGSTSSIDEIARVKASQEADMVLVNRIYKETTCPMICADFNSKQQRFFSMIREKFGLDLLTEWHGSTLGPQALQLQFKNGISTPVPTGMNIEGKDHKPFVVALADGVSGQIVNTGAAAAMEVEIVVLEGDSNDDEAENYTCGEFNNKIVSEWNGKKVLQGNTFLKLKRVYNKKDTPSLSDYVYRLYNIDRRGGCFDHLKNANIKTVMDIRTLNAINPKRLKDMLAVCPMKWKVIMDHAHKCEDDKGIYLYHYPRDGQKSNGVVFNIYGRLVGLIAESQFIPCDKLPNDKRADAEKMIVSSSEHWEEAVSFKDEASLIKHSQPVTTLNSLCNRLNNVVIQSQSQSQSQSLKRPASENTISNSPRKPRDDRGTTNTNVYNGRFEEYSELSLEDLEEEDYGQYTNLLQSDRWTRVWCVVGWISMISKIRKRRMTTFCHQIL